MPIASLPPHVKLAVLAAEDAGFYEHEGLNYWGIARAFLVNLRARHDAPGRLDHHAAGREEPAPRHERAHALAARSARRSSRRKLEQELTKDEILELYINNIYFGRGRYGIEEAARDDFGKSARDIDIAEAALIAGRIANPRELPPAREHETALARRAYVLDQMHAKAFLGDAQWEAAQDGGACTSRRRSKPASELAPEAVERGEGAPLRVEPDAGAARRASPSRRRSTRSCRRPRARRVRDGARGVRQAARAAGRARSRRRRPPRARERAAPPRDALVPFDGTPAFEQHKVLVGVVDGRRRRGGHLRRARGHGAGTREARRLRRATTRRNLPPSAFAPVGAHVRVSLLAAGRRTARRRCGSSRGPRGRSSRSTCARGRSSRSSAATRGRRARSTARRSRAASRGRRSSRSSTRTRCTRGASRRRRSSTPAPRRVRGRLPARPTSRAGRGTIRCACARRSRNSVNVAAVRVLHDVGPANVVPWAQALGIESPMKPDLSLALGSYEVRPVELAGAYATFAAGGTYEEPRLVTRIVGPDGKDVPLPDAPPPRRVLDDAEAYVDDEHARERRGPRHGGAREVARAAAWRARRARRNGPKDTWFAGYSTDVAAVVWVGYDDGRAARRRGAGRGHGAARVGRLHEGRDGRASPRVEFPRPPGVVTVSIDKRTGELPYPDDPDVMDEVFLAGNGAERDGEPQPPDDAGSAMRPRRTVMGRDEQQDAEIKRGETSSFLTSDLAVCSLRLAHRAGRGRGRGGAQDAAQGLGPDAGGERGGHRAARERRAGAARRRAGAAHRGARRGAARGGRARAPADGAARRRRARSRGGRGALVYVQTRDRARGTCARRVDVYPSMANAWDRIRNPLPAPTGHAFASAKIDAEVRAFLAPLVLEQASVHRAKHDEGDVLAAACGDVDGDGGDELRARVARARRDRARARREVRRRADRAVGGARAARARADARAARGRRRRCRARWTWGRRTARVCRSRRTWSGHTPLLGDAGVEQRGARVSAAGRRRRARSTARRSTATMSRRRAADAWPCRRPGSTRSRRRRSSTRAEGPQSIVVVREPSGRREAQDGRRARRARRRLRRAARRGRPRSGRSARRGHDGGRAGRRGERVLVDAGRDRPARPAAPRGAGRACARSRCARRSRTASRRSWPSWGASCGSCAPGCRGRRACAAKRWRPTLARGDPCCAASSSRVWRRRRRSSALPRAARASARTPYGGRLVLHAPWPLAAIDPHRIDDATAAFFGPAVFDTLYARDPDGSDRRVARRGRPGTRGRRAAHHAAPRPALRVRHPSRRARSSRVDCPRARPRRERVARRGAGAQGGPRRRCSSRCATRASWCGRSRRRWSRSSRRASRPIGPTARGHSAPSSAPRAWCSRATCPRASGPGVPRRDRGPRARPTWRRRCAPSRAGPTTWAGSARSCTSRAPAPGASTPARSAGPSFAPGAMPARPTRRARRSRSPTVCRTRRSRRSSSALPGSRAAPAGPARRSRWSCATTPRGSSSSRGRSPRRSRRRAHEVRAAPVPAAEIASRRTSRGVRAHARRRAPRGTVAPRRARRASPPRTTRPRPRRSCAIRRARTCPCAR